MAEEKTLAEVWLSDRHRPTGFTRHYFGFAGGVSVEVPPPVSLRLVQYPGDAPWVYLFYCDATGEEMTDTLHDSLDEAMDQAEAEFGVRRQEWTLVTDGSDEAATFPDLAWWLQDHERWQLLAFDGRRDDVGLPIDLASKDRREVLEALVCVPGRADADFARFLLAQETLWHGHAWGFSPSIEMAALLVAEHRADADVWLLWEAIARSFDTWLGLPHGLLHAAGKGSVLAHVESSDHPQRPGLLEYLPEIQQITDADVTQLLADRRRHYRQILDGLNSP